jgi:ketosteroid isomerase-like protein
MQGHSNPPSPLSALFVTVACAQETSDGASTPEQAARQALEEYREAHERGDVDRLAALYVSFPQSQREAVADYAKNADDLHVEIANVKIEPRQYDLVVSYTRRDRFVDKESGEPMVLEVQLTRFLVQDRGRWKFMAEQ